MKWQSKHGIICTTLEVGIGVLLVFSAFNIINSIYVNPGNSISYQIDTPLETYVFNEPYNVSTIIIAPTYIVFNETGFNVTSSNSIDIRIDHIDEDISSPADSNDDLLVFTITDTGGDTWFNLSGFSPTISYTVKVNSLFFSTEIANGDGSISFFDNPGVNDEYSIFWTAGTNTAPVITNPFPANGSTSISTSGSPVNVYLSDVDGNDMNVSVWSNHTGSWVNYAGFSKFIETSDYVNSFMRDVPPVGTWNYLDTGSYTFTAGWQPDGIRAAYGNITVTDDWGMTTSYTKYWWSVNVTDSLLWTNNTYHFTTAGTGLPVVQTNDPTNIQEINVTLQGELLNDGGEDAWCRFQWGNTSNPLGQGTTNQTHNSGESYSSGVKGNLTSWYNSDWLYRKQITIDSEYIDADLLNFPVFINDIDSNYQYARDPDGYDFLFTTSDGMTKLNHELVRFDYGLNTIEAWVNVTSISSTSDTTIYLYWGNLSATNQENLNGTWETGYVGVYHLDEQSGSGNTVIDSSSNGNDATYKGDLPTRNSTRCGYAQYFDGDNDYIDFPQIIRDSLQGNTASISSQMKHEIYGSAMTYYVIGDGVAGSSSGENFTTSSYNGVNTWTYDGYANNTQSWDGQDTYNFDHENLWFMNAYLWDSSTAQIAGAVSGSYQSSSVVAADVPSGSYGYMHLGINWDYTNDYRGYVDEIRVYDKRNNVSWIKADTFNNNQTSGFVTYWSAESEWSDTGNLSAGTLYKYRAVANNSNGVSYGDNISFLTKPYEPRLLAALAENQSAIQLTWTQIDGSGYNTTYIERSTSSVPWVRGNGYNVYNGTLFSHNDTNLSWGTTYYYQAWSFTNWSDDTTTLYQYSVNFDSANNQTNSLPVFSNIIPVNNTIVDVAVDINMTIIDPDGHTFNWTIETLPDIGSKNGNDEANGSKACPINSTHTSTYTWFVNCTDSYDWINRTYNFTSMIQYVAVPTNGVSDYHPTVNYLNLSWDNNSGISETYRTDNYVLVQRNDTYATSATQSGNWIRQNNTRGYWNESWTETSGGYFTVFGYNDTANMYSYTNATPLGLDLPWGALALRCFSENNPEIPLIGWDIEITNSSFTETYAATDITNTHYLDMEDIPYGIGTIFQVSNDSYETRSYTYDIAQNNFYNLTFYLPKSIPEGGTGDPEYDENETYSEDYVIHVVGPQSEYGVDPPIEDAEVIIRKYINTTESYETVGVYITDADGTFTVPLLPNNLYSFNLSATGYYDAIESWMPVEIVFEGDRHKTFRLAPLAGEDIIDDDYIIFWDTITFTGVMNDIDGLNGTITITYDDSNLSTIDTQIYIYEHYLGVSTLIAMISNTSENSITYTTGTINTTRRHSAVLYFNNTANFDANSPVSIQILPINIWSTRDDFDFEDRVTKIFGPWGFGYASALSAILAIIALVLFGPHNTGIGIMASGFTLAITSSIFTILFTGGIRVELTILAPIIIIIAGIYMLVKDPGGHL